MDRVNKQMLRDALDQHLKDKLVGQTNDVEKTKNIITSILNTHIKTQTIKQYDPNIKVTRLWDSWTLKQKFIWFICNKVLKFLGNEVRHIVDGANQDLREQSEDIEFNYLHIEYPYYAILFPKTIIVLDIKIYPNQGMKIIKLDLEVNK